MKELNLSLLSRGCGQLVSSEGNTGGHDGRLDVCFTPQDYYIWKSQESVLRLTNSGRLLAAAEQALPKTYSTRRGPLLLYSQDLVTTKTNCELEAGQRKKRVVRRHTQQVEQQRSTLKALTAAILNYSNYQSTFPQPAQSIFPSLRFPPVQDLHCPGPLSIQPARAQPRPEFVPVNAQWPPAEDTQQLERQPEKEVELDSRKIIRLDVFLQRTCTSRTPTPQTESQSWVHYVATTPEEPEDTQSENSLHTEIKYHDVVVDGDCTIQRNSGTDHDIGSCERSSGRRHRTKVRPNGADRQSNTESETTSTSGESLPPLKMGHSTCNKKTCDKTDRVSWGSPDSAGHRAQRLPPIAENCTVASARGIQHQSRMDARQLRSERHGIKAGENPLRLHEQPLTLPPLFSEKDAETSGKLRGGKEKSARQCFKKQSTGQEEGGGGRLTSVTILLEPEKGIQHTEAPPPPLPPAGVLGCISGWKGPSKQTSLACFHNRPLHLQEPSDANRSVVKGVLPLELRDLQDDKSAGCLILGPDGEIIQLSLYDNNGEPSQANDGAQQRALQVLSSEGEKLPWVIVLQSDSHTEEDMELDTDDVEEKMQPRQPQHKRTGSHMTLSQSASGERSVSTEQLLDSHISPESETWSPNSNADTVTPKIGEVVLETQMKKTKKEARHSVRMSPQREWVGRKKPGEGDTEAEEGKEDGEEADTTGQHGLFSGSHQSGLSRKKYKGSGYGSQQNVSPDVATSEDAVDRRRKNIRKKDTDEAAVTSGKRDLKSVKTSESEAQTKSNKSKEGGGNISRPIRSHKPGARTNREAAGARESAPPSVEKETGSTEGEEEKMNEESEVRGGATVRKKIVSDGRKWRKRRGRLTHDADEDLDEGVDFNQEMEEESYLKYIETPPASQNHKNKTKTEDESETDHLPTSAERRSIRSVGSLRSSDVASHSIQRTTRRSAASSYEGTAPAGVVDFASSRGRLSSCSTVMVMDEQLMLNPVKPELSKLKKSQEEQAALRLAQRAERRRQEVERKRREREEEERKQQEREQMEERMKGELEEERRKRVEELRLKKVAEEEERRRREEEGQMRVRQEQARRESERRRQEDRRRQVERLQKMREEDEQRRKAELERLQLEEQTRQEEESRMLQEMDEGERFEYLRRKEQEEEERRNSEKERKRREEEAALRAAEEARLQAQKLLREMALLQQHLTFKRDLTLEAGGLENTQGISRPWIYSYFSLLQLLGLNPTPS